MSILMSLYVGLYFGRSDDMRLKNGSYVQLNLRSTGWYPFIAKCNTSIWPMGNNSPIRNKY